MGWQSSGDPLQGTHIFFKSKEDAIHFAEKQGMFISPKDLKPCC
jgi:NADH dehydrogenase (ubiquinone) Fe-S protein 4